MRDFYMPFFPRIRGEMTASYAAGLDDDILRELWLLNPNLKIIILLRNPVQRAWSHAKMYFTKQGRLEQVSHDELIAFFQSDYISKCGEYSDILSAWEARWGAQNVFAGSFNDICERPRELLQDILRFLGVRSDAGVIPADHNNIVGKTPELPMPDNIRYFLESKYTDQLGYLAHRFQSLVR
jgi:hypothetical protein